jgi:ATP/maltotriose-dependent transcriptional regulator MalT
LIASGLSRGKVAIEMRVKETTVAWHLQRIYAKLEVHSKAAAVARAIRLGLLD